VSKGSVNRMWGEQVPYSYIRRPVRIAVNVHNLPFRVDSLRAGAALLAFPRILGGFLRTNALVDFFAMNRDIGGCRYADPHLIAIDAEHRYRNIAANSDSLADPARENEHLNLVPC
jgi:hypothetical protein